MYENTRRALQTEMVYGGCLPIGVIDCVLETAVEKGLENITSFGILFVYHQVQ